MLSLNALFLAARLYVFISGAVYLRLDQVSPACCVSLKCPCVWPTWLRPFFYPLLLFYYCFLSLSVLLNSRTQMSSLFSPPPLSLLLRSRCLCSARLFYVISGVSSSVFIIPSSQFFIHVFTRRDVSIHPWAPFLCVQACSMYLHTWVNGCRNTSFLQCVCLIGPRELIQ